MPLILTAWPAVEPVALDEAKRFLRVDGDEEDALVASLILAARAHVERHLGLALITQGWSLYLDRWPQAGPLVLPLAPAQTVDAVTLYDDGDQPTPVDPAIYAADTVSRRARLVPRAGRSWPQPGREVNGIEIAFTVGYGDGAADVPAPVVQALRLLIAHWYENRDLVAPGVSLPVPVTVESLLAPYREPRL